MTKSTATVATTGAVPLADDSSVTNITAAPNALDGQDAGSRGHRVAWLALVLAVVIVAGVLAVTLVERDGGTRTTPRVADESPLVDGRGFNDAVERAVSGAESTPSPFVDGRGFNDAVERAVSGAESTPSPFVDGAGFEQVVNDAVVEAAR